MVEVFHACPRAGMDCREMYLFGDKSGKVLFLISSGLGNGFSWPKYGIHGSKKWNSYHGSKKLNSRLKEMEFTAQRNGITAGKPIKQQLVKSSSCLPSRYISCLLVSMILWWSTYRTQY
jgi:hypothetical protein